MTEAVWTVTGRHGVTLSYGREGRADGTALVLLHSLGADRQMWDPCVPALARAHRLLLPDTRGHGRSGRSATATVEDWVDDLEDVLDHADVGEVVLVGVSLGGVQAMAFAAAHPGRVKGLVVADSFAELPRDIADVKIRNLRDQALSRSMPAVADRYIADTFQRPFPDGAAAVRRSLAGMDAASYVAAVEACFSVRIRDHLRSIESPTLVLWGDRDAKTPRPLSEQIVQAIRGARLQVLTDAGHLSNIDNPDGFAAAVDAFSTACDDRHARLRAEGGIWS